MVQLEKPIRFGKEIARLQSSFGCIPKRYFTTKPRRSQRVFLFAHPVKSEMGKNSINSISIALCLEP